jgi:hypothetical protein
VDAAFAQAANNAFPVVCPELIKTTADGVEVLTLVLPGDPAHSVQAVSVPGKSRYVLRGERWLAEDPKC